MASKPRSALARFDDLPGSIPSSKVPEKDLSTIGTELIQQLESLKVEHLASDALWRDIVTLTGTYRTFHSAQVICETFNALSQKRGLSGLRCSTPEPRKEAAIQDSWIDFDIEFECSQGNLQEKGAGIVSVAFDDKGDWRIWMIRTWLERFDGHGDPDVPLSNKTAAANGPGSLDNVEYGAIVVGAGQVGLSLAGRLQALDVPYILLEKFPSVGDVWANRYPSLHWHTIKEYGNLPFGHTYTEAEAQFLPTQRIAATQLEWATKNGLNVRTGMTVTSATFDALRETWTVNAETAEGKKIFKGKNLILSLGSGLSTPRYPEWATSDAIAAQGYKGTIMHGLVDYRDPSAWKGKRGIVVGTANTAHDIAEDMVEHGISTTMVQRDPTFVFPEAWLTAAMNPHYNAQSDPGVADRHQVTMPFKIGRDTINRAVWHGIKAMPKAFDDLEAAGFRLNRFGDIYHNLFVRGGGHYLDTGASARITSGEIGIKAAHVRGLTPDGIAFEDGTEIKTDLIVLCTGFLNNFRDDATRILGAEIADQMDNYWGIDKEGELRGMGKPAGFPRLYYQGGDIRMARFLSRFTALQVQADLLGHPFQPYLE